MRGYRGQAGLASLSFVLATVAGFVYSDDRGSLFAGVPVLAVAAVAWAVLWALAHNETPGPRLERRIGAARVSIVAGLIVAVALFLAAG